MNTPEVAREESGTRRGVIIAFVAGGLAILLVSFVANTLQKQPRKSGPPIVIVGPGNKAVSNPAIITFVTSAPLQKTAQGWSAGDLHPHAIIDSTTMMMPMPGDIRPVQGDTFKMTLGNLPIGRHSIMMFWANAAHIGVGDSVSTVVIIAH
jgi:hypothetical protein